VAAPAHDTIASGRHCESRGMGTLPESRRLLRRRHGTTARRPQEIRSFPQA